MLKLLLAVAAILVADPGAPEPPSERCVPKEVAVTQLLEKYHESVVVNLQGKSGAHWVIFASPAGSTWTLALETQQGYCFLDSGKAWPYSSI